MFTFYPMIAHLHMEKKRKENAANNYVSLTSLDKSTNYTVRGKVSLTPQTIKELQTKKI